MKGIIFALILLWSAAASASHSFGGLDMCALYPEVMPPGLNPEQLPEAGGQGAMLMQNYCTQCHELPGPGRHTAEEWPQVLERMLTLMDVANRFSGLLGNVKAPVLNERVALQNYLTRHALQPLLQKPQGQGANAFVNHCSACHALPNLEQYNMYEWLSVLKRMQRNMVTMKYPPPSAEVMMRIQFYLQQHNASVSMDSTRFHQQAFTDTATQKQATPDKQLRSGSWLALGPFLVLMILGLVRWWNSAHKTSATNNARQIQV